VTIVNERHLGISEATRRQMREIIARYPHPRSALIPMLHLVQSEQGYVTTEGIEACAHELGLTSAEVAAVATFYTMFKRRPIGDYHVGVCTNSLCAVMGGDALFTTLQEHLGVGNDETTEDGKVTLEHVECNAACDYAPVVMVNWEFFDNQTPDSVRALVDALRADQPVAPTRGSARVCTWRETSRILAGFYDGRAEEGTQAGGATLVGLRLAQEHGWEAPVPERQSAAQEQEAVAEGREASEETAAEAQDVATSDSDAPLQTSESDPANPHQPGSNEEGD
jgi:NADH-quinone oxidoreductase subunit E